MHLKSLRLQGFKTFARRTELNFGGGITAIVGPNGSGKSNLVDAIRWALGERNARGLRGHRMEDVIYAGGPGKSAVGMAEVTLVLDNADQRLNVEFTEVEVARRLFRSGESEYLINGSRARLKDIDALLASTGLRQDGYAVTAQNDIDYVIQAAPGVRRELIEEAAGVRRLRDQRQEALNRLTEADRDMRRARDILNELMPRSEELRVQAQAAEEYRSVAESLKALQGSLARDAWRKAMVQLRRALNRLQAGEQKRSGARQAIAAFEPVYDEHRDALLKAREARWHQQEAVAELRLRLAEAQHQGHIAQERTVASVQALESLQRELRRLQESEQAGSRVVSELSHAVTDAELELEAAEVSLRSASEAERVATDARGQREASQSSLQAQRQQSQREALSIAAELRQLEGRLLFLEDQQKQVHQGLDEWSARSKSLAAELDSRRSVAAAADEALRGSTASLSALETQLSDTEDCLREARQSVIDHESQLRAVEAQLIGLRTVLDGAQRYSSLPDGWPRLLETLQVDIAHRPAVEAALEGWLHGWIAPGAQAADRAAAALREADHTRETLLWDAAMPLAEDSNDGTRRLLAVIDAPEAVLAILRPLLADLILVEDRAEARRVLARSPQLRAVTSDGELLTAYSYRGGKAADSVLTVQSRIREAEAALGEERKASLEAADKVEHWAAERLRLLSERQLGLTRQDAARSAAAQAAGALTAASDAMLREAQQESQLRDQLHRLAAALQQAEETLAATRERQQLIAEREAVIEEELSASESIELEQAAALNELVKQRQQAELRSALARQRLDDLRLQLERAQQLVQSHGQELAQRRTVEVELAVQPALITEERRQWLERSASLQAELEALEAQVLPDDDAINLLEAQLREDEQRNVQLQVELAHADDACAAALIERDAAQLAVDQAAAGLRDDGRGLEDMERLDEEVDWQKTEREVSRLQRRLEAMGAVNLLAPEEFAQVSERCQSLNAQLVDLGQASAQLNQLRQQLEAEIDERFRTVFQAVAVNFQEFFGELFVGGRATLRLESEPDANPLDEGVEILAQTPGKRLQPLTLLSGGERALTALAFLFALQAVNPSPFYVLDEVDAALDDANVVRFNRVLKRLATGQQFLIVTHNHSTMAQAEALYGVTLGEHGISRIVSVRLHRDNLVPVGERTA